jgi:hypothetical protein
MAFLDELNEFIDYANKARPSVSTATVAVTERTARKVLRLKKAEPLAYRGMALKCIGSRRYRREHQ